jgi:RNA polymerase sigma factor (sigma-70 family)
LLLQLARELKTKVAVGGRLPRLYTEELILGVSSDECTPEAMLVRDAETQAVRSVLNAMSPPLREILILREFEELSYRQIAEITALPIGTVMSRLARARKAFAAAWQREKQSNATNETELFTTRSSEVSARSAST